jgi:hypothetical protein
MQRFILVLRRKSRLKLTDNVVLTSDISLALLKYVYGLGLGMPVPATMCTQTVFR